MSAEADPDIVALGNRLPQDPDLPYAEAAESPQMRVRNCQYAAGALPNKNYGASLKFFARPLALRSRRFLEEIAAKRPADEASNPPAKLYAINRFECDSRPLHGRV